MTADKYSVWVDDLPEETIEAVDIADCQAKLAAHLRSDGLAHIGDDVNVTVRAPDGAMSTSTVADHRGHRVPG